MIDLEICRLSAEALEKRHVLDRDREGNSFIRLEKYPGDLNGGEWNPLANAEQRWECHEWLVEEGYDILTYPGGEPDRPPQHRHWARRHPGPSVDFNCPLKERDARAVAEIYKRRQGE